MKYHMFMINERSSSGGTRGWVVPLPRSRGEVLRVWRLGSANRARLQLYLECIVKRSCKKQRRLQVEREKRDEAVSELSS